jgi:[protein-PII] uridylyltransferase
MVADARFADSQTLRAALERHREGLVDMLEPTPAPPGGEQAHTDGISLGRANAAFLDACFQSRFEAAAAIAKLPRNGVALAAVGSFGRGAVALRSDADVTVVVGTRAGAREARAFAEALLYPLWDATLQVGHQVLDVREAVALATSDLPTATALLDMRYLGGDPQLIPALAARAYEGLFGETKIAAFLERLDAEAAGRRERFGSSVYLLEPDVKSGAGGLRDLDGLHWAARARYPRSEASGGAGVGAWRELVRIGVLVAREAHEIQTAEEFLWRVRNRLHARAGRKADRLGFDEQEAIAVAMGYGDDRARAAERLMQDYYLHARAVMRARESLFRRLEPPRRRPKTPPQDLGGGVHLYDGHVTIAGTAELHEDPAIAMRLYAASVRHGAPVLPFARDAVAREAGDLDWCERLRALPEAASIFVELLCHVPETKTRAGSMIGELHDVGILLAMVPEFLPVTGRVHHDVYHVYTVDVHSVAAVDRLRQLARGELAHEFPLASRLAAEIGRPARLFLATLLHDVGKGWPDATGSRRGHSQTGAELCDKILPRLGLGSSDVQEARRLVVQHLLMYHVATRRDLDDSATIEEFCRSVPDRECLRDLFLLTVSDLSTTSPTAMTTWKARMLDELYFAAEAYLSRPRRRGEAGPRADEQRLVAIKESVHAAAKAGVRKLDTFLDSMPERYLFANEPESIVVHARAVAERQGKAAQVERVPSAQGGAAELCVVASDRPGLLASIAAAITANRLEVLAAQVYSRKVRGRHEVEAVDVFWVRDREGGIEGVEASLARLGRDLEGVCSGAVNPAELLASRVGSSSPWRERPSPAVPVEVIVDDRASPRHTVVEVFAKDRPGLLYTLAHALHDLGLSIALSKINTEGTRVADVFYVSELDGSKVSPGPRYKEIQEGLLRAIG